MAGGLASQGGGRFASRARGWSRGGAIIRATENEIRSADLFLPGESDSECDQSAFQVGTVFEMCGRRPRGQRKLAGNDSPGIHWFVLESAPGVFRSLWARHLHHDSSGILESAGWRKNCGQINARHHANPGCEVAQQGAVVYPGHATTVWP